MTNALSTFHRNVRYATDILHLGQSLEGLLTPVIDVSDTYRAAWVAAISAQDAYFHHVIRELMVEIGAGRRAKTDSFRRFRIPLESLDLASTTHVDLWLDGVIAGLINHLSFQQPDKIADGIRLISTIELWNEVGKVFNQPSVDIKLKQKLIADRRNQIAHEADSELVPPFERRAISHADALDALSFVIKVVDAIDSLL
jgi:hypothetical protein